MSIVTITDFFFFKHVHGKLVDRKYPRVYRHVECTDRFVCFAIIIPIANILIPDSGAADNQLEGTLPESIGNLTSLKYL
jgi:hypothetical protein